MCISEDYIWLMQLFFHLLKAFFLKYYITIKVDFDAKMSRWVGQNPTFPIALNMERVNASLYPFNKFLQNKSLLKYSIIGI